LEERRKEFLMGLLGAIDIGEPSGLRPALDTALPFRWGKSLTVEEAEEIARFERVAVPGTAEKQNVFTALRNFFVSPDVFPTFSQKMREKDMGKVDFITLVNTFIVTPVTPRQMEAFLTICHDNGDLFTITMTGGVSVCDQGWELVHEMPRHGPARRIRLLPPADIDWRELEQWLASPPNRRRLGISVGYDGRNPRVFSEQQLITAIINLQYRHMKRELPRIETER
jgi:hypothetical protein